MQRQARAPKTQPFGAEASDASDGTFLRRLGMAGFLINSRGTTLMVDTLLGGFDMPVMIEFPIAADDVPKLDAVLSDNDHFSVPTCGDLARVTDLRHGGGGEGINMVCGAVRFDHPVARKLLAVLPRILTPRSSTRARRSSSGCAPPCG